MRKVYYIFISFLLVGIPISCEDSILIVDCDKCYTDVSNTYNIEIKITFDSENYAVPITVYKGDIDNGEIIIQDTAYSSPYYTDDLFFGHKYSAIAKYSHKGRIIYAVDGRELRKKYEKSSCDDPCYVIKGDVLDLRLK